MLNEHQITQVERTGARLRSDVARLVETFPPTAKALSGMARWLDIHKATCQRLFDGLTKSADGLDTISLMPGVEGLRSIVVAARERGCPSDLVDAVAAAIDHFEHTIELYGGSHRALVREIQESRPERRPEQVIASRQAGDHVRRRHFESACQITGEESDGRAALVLVRPSAERNDVLSEYMFSLMLGVRRQPHARPIVRMFRTYLTPQELPSQPRSNHTPPLPNGLVSEFSTPGLRTIPLVSDEHVTKLLIDPDHRHPDPIDVVTRHYAPASQPNPMLRPPHLWAHGIMVSYPARALVYDFFLHESLAMTGLPSNGVYPLTAAVLAQASISPPAETWYQRLPETPELRILGRGTAHTPPECCPRMNEVADMAFKTSGWDPRSFVRYRTEVLYPIWGCEYRTTCEFVNPKSLLAQMENRPASSGGSSSGGSGSGGSGSAASGSGGTGVPPVA